MLPVPLAADAFGPVLAFGSVFALPASGAFATGGIFSTGFLGGCAFPDFSSIDGLAGGGEGATFAGGTAATLGGGVLGWAAGAGAGGWRMALIPTATASMATTASTVPSRGLRRRLSVTREAVCASLSATTGCSSTAGWLRGAVAASSIAAPDAASTA